MWGRHYMTAYVDHEDCDVILVDNARERRQPFVEHYGIETVYDTVEDMLKAEVPDIVSAILPVAVAPAAVMACAEAGVKAISCEKPIALELSQADGMVRVCRERGIPFGCATAFWEVPFLQETAAWIAQGNIGRPTSAAIPGGLPREVAGAGCVQLVQMRGLTGMEAEWVEGWTLPSAEGYRHPEASDLEADCPAYGRIGLSGGIVCEVPEPRPEDTVPCRVSLEGENGRVWISRNGVEVVQGQGAESTPVYPPFLQEDHPRRSMRPAIDRLIGALKEGANEVPCSGHDYRQALEIAMAIKLSAHRGHERVSLPLEDRSQRIYPHPYRLQGGDAVGWDSVGYESPPIVDGRVHRKR